MPKWILLGHNTSAAGSSRGKNIAPHKEATKYITELRFSIPTTIADQIQQNHP
jgi:hypothetical protein